MLLSTNLPRTPLCKVGSMGPMEILGCNPNLKVEENNLHNHLNECHQTIELAVF